MRFGIPPKSLEALSTAQLYALYVADQTLADARLSIEETTPEQRARTSVILGVGGMGNTGVQIAQRATVPDWARVLRQLELPEEAVQAIIGELTALYANWPQANPKTVFGNNSAGFLEAPFSSAKATKRAGSNFTQLHFYGFKTLSQAGCPCSDFIEPLANSTGTARAALLGYSRWRPERSVGFDECILVCKLGWGADYLVKWIDCRFLCYQSRRNRELYRNSGCECDGSEISPTRVEISEAHSELL